MQEKISVIKVAVCISGQPRGDYKKCREQLKLNFPDADFYYSAWEGCETDVDTWFIEEPVMEYHPYGDIPKDIVLSERLADKIPKFMSKPHEVERTSHQTKQILAHAYMVEKYPDYDVYVRSRWDTYTWPEANFDPFLWCAHNDKNAIGFGTPSQNISVIREERNNPYTQYFLFDQLIIHSNEAFDPEYVYKLHREKRLIAAEWGWWQVMSKGGHRCMHGWANPISHVFR